MQLIQDLQLNKFISKRSNMLTFEAQIPGGGKITIACVDEKDVFRAASFWQSLPHVCPIDGTPTRLEHRQTKKGDDYWSVASTGPVVLELHVTHRKVGGKIFNSGKWHYYDGREKHLIMDDGVCTPYGKSFTERLKGNKVPTNRQFGQMPEGDEGEQPTQPLQKAKPSGVAGSAKEEPAQKREQAPALRFHSTDDAVAFGVSRSVYPDQATSKLGMIELYKEWGEPGKEDMYNWWSAHVEAAHVAQTAVTAGVYKNMEDAKVAMGKYVEHNGQFVDDKSVQDSFGKHIATLIANKAKVVAG